MQTELTDQIVQPDLRAYLRPLWTRKWLILAIVAIVAGATYAYYDSKPRVYTTGSSIYVGQSDAQTALGQAQSFQSDRTLQNTATLLKTKALAERVAKRLEYKGAPTALLGNFSAAAQSGADFITITATWNTAQGAADLANAVAEEFVDLQSEDERSGLESGLREREKQLAAIPKSVATANERGTLQTTISQLRLALSLPTGGASVVSQAATPGSATSPRPTRNAIFAAVLALLTGVGLAFGLDRFDRRIKTVEDVRNSYRLPLLSVIPHSAATNYATERGSAVASEFREPFRDLLTNVQLMALDRPVRKLLITSAVPGEGKSTVVRNLAIVLREYGLSIAIVDADLRRPTQYQLLGVSEDQGLGLSTVLTGQSTLAEALDDVRVDVRGLETLRRIRAQSAGAAPAWVGAHPPEAGQPSTNGSDEGGLRLLSAGPVPANPQAVLASDRTREVIDELAATHDLVLIDSPPLLAVSDSVPLLAQVDAVILVARLDVATRDQGRRLIEILDRVPGDRWIGVVANDMRTGDVAYSYGYAYGYKARKRARLDDAYDFSDRRGILGRLLRKPRNPDEGQSSRDSRSNGRQRERQAEDDRVAH
jgi:Mrp family chromosome partitioning ATPase